MVGLNFLVHTPSQPLVKSCYCINYICSNVRDHLRILMPDIRWNCFRLFGEGEVRSNFLWRQTTTCCASIFLLPHIVWWKYHFIGFMPSFD